MNYSLQHIATELFKEWCDNAEESFPDLIKPIANEKVLVKDLTSTLLKAKNYLVTEEDPIYRQEQGYDYDFIIGFTWSALNKRWFRQYVAKNSDRYKELTMLKAMWEYLKIDTTAGIKINTLYETMLSNDLNTLDPKLSFDSKISNKHGLGELIAQQGYSQKGTHVYNYLEQEISMHINKIFDVDPENFLPELEDYIGSDLIELILCPNQN